MSNEPVQNSQTISQLEAAPDKETQRAGTERQDAKKSPETDRARVITEPLAGDISEARGPDPFDPQSLVLDQSYLVDCMAQALLVGVALRKPEADEFFRVHPAKEYRLGPVAIVASPFTQDRGQYVIDPILAQRAKAKHRICILRVCINLSEAIFLWPVPIPGAGGSPPIDWHITAVRAVEKAELQWIKLVTDRAAGNYVPYPARGEIAEPIWPKTPPVELFRTALRDRHIVSEDHPVYRRLQGYTS
jgi:hypothetical protein